MPRRIRKRHSTICPKKKLFIRTKHTEEQQEGEEEGEEERRKKKEEEEEEEEVEGEIEEGEGDKTRFKGGSKLTFYAVFPQPVCFSERVWQCYVARTKKSLLNFVLRSQI
jgi:hypothetical protein